MLRATRQNNFQHGASAGARFLVCWTIWPDAFRHHLAITNAHKVERGVRLQTALKANKVDIRSLLALPVTDHAHPYKREQTWEKVTARADPGSLTPYGKWYRAKVLNFYEGMQYHKWGMYADDAVGARGWWSRASRTRAPKAQLIGGDRRVIRARMLKTQWYAYLPKHQWVAPIDNVAWYSPYVTMVLDEWEEKWGFFGGQETEY